jgi:hypothetical protein
MPDDWKLGNKEEIKMENNMHYFKRPTLGNYVKVAFFRFIMYVLLFISLAIGLKLFFWWIGKSSPNASKVVYLLLFPLGSVGIILIKSQRNLQN